MANVTMSMLQNLLYLEDNRLRNILEVPFKIAAKRMVTNYPCAAASDTYLLILVVFTLQTNYSPGQTTKST